jgi:hypothetical protein
MIFYRQQIRQFRYIGRNSADCAHQQFRGSGRAVSQSMAIAKFSSKAFFALLAEIESGTL